MKQTIILCKAFLFFLFAMGICNDSYGTERPIDTNWYNSMIQHGAGGDDFCVEVLSDNLLFFDLKVRFADQNVQAYPAMMIYFHDVVNGISGFTPRVTPAMVELVNLGYGVPTYQATFTVKMDMTRDCGISSLFCAEMQYQLVTDEDPKNLGDTVAYPLADNLGLFPQNIFCFSENIGRANYWQVFKEICCEVGGPPGTSDPCNGLNGQHIINNGLSTFIPLVWLVANPNNGYVEGQLPAKESLQKHELEKVDEINLQEIQVSPNPFKDHVTLRLDYEGLPKINIDCFDIHGRAMTLNTTEGSENITLKTSDWIPGIYYLRIKKLNEAKTFKLIKTQ